MSDIQFQQCFKGSMNVLGSQLKYPDAVNPQIERWLVTLPPQSVGNWHIHLVPEFFYVTSGALYVVNETKEDDLAVTIFNKGDHGLTDCHIPQFIWNPDKCILTTVTAIYIGDQSITPTKNLGKRPDQELLDQLMQKAITNNLTEIHNAI